MRALALLLPLLFLLPGAGATDCTTWSTSVWDEDTIVLTHPSEFGDAPRYTVVDICPSLCYSLAYTYVEANGIAGLQRGDIDVDDTCHGMIEMDSLNPF